MIGNNPIYLLGWLLAATILLSLAGLTAAPFHADAGALVMVPA
jgi:hypothetical protein